MLGMKIIYCIDVKVYFESVGVRVRVHPYLPFQLPQLQSHTVTPLGCLNNGGAQIIWIREGSTVLRA